MRLAARAADDGVLAVELEAAADDGVLAFGLEAVAVAARLKQAGVLAFGLEAMAARADGDGGGVVAEGDAKWRRSVLRVGYLASGLNGKVPFSPATYEHPEPCEHAEPCERHHLSCGHAPKAPHLPAELRQSRGACGPAQACSSLLPVKPPRRRDPCGLAQPCSYLLPAEPPRPLGPSEHPPLPLLPVELHLLHDPCGLAQPCASLQLGEGRWSDDFVRPERTGWMPNPRHECWLLGKGVVLHSFSGNRLDDGSLKWRWLASNKRVAKQLPGVHYGQLVWLPFLKWSAVRGGIAVNESKPGPLLQDSGKARCR